MTEIKLNLENLTEDERKQLTELVEKANKAESKAWKPKDYEPFWAISRHGTISQIRFLTENCDEADYAIGNCFKTKEEAEFAIERFKIRAELQRYADEHNEPIDWCNDRQRKHGIHCDYTAKKLYVYFHTTCREPFQIYFSSQEIAEAAIKAVGEERIKKYLFGVE